MSGGSKPTGTQTTTTAQNTAPWEGQQQYLRDGFQIAREQFDYNARNNAPTYFPGATYVPQSSFTTWGQNDLFNRAQNVGVANGQQAERAMGQQAYGLLTNGASGQPGYGTLAATANGNMIGRNPEFNGMVSRAVEAARPSIDSQFAGAGRLGSGAHANAMASTATNLAGNLAYGDYQQERSNQLGAAQGLLSSNLAARGLGAQIGQQAIGNDYQNMQAKLQAGAIQEGYSEKALEDQINRHNYEQNLQANLLERYLAQISGAYGVSSSGTQTSPVYGKSGFSSALGSAGAGAAIGTAIMPGWGTAIGAGVGAIGGLLSR